MKISTELAVSSQTQSDIEQHVDNENVISDSVSDNEGYYYLNQFLNIIGIFAMLYGFIFSLGLMGDSFKITLEGEPLVFYSKIFLILFRV